ncbi:hypothetical protein FTO74_04655 [Granulicella sp. WH15]|nr:hypothetical protein FTO74_04655 [Granulicella sp. WH15]
MCKRRENSIQGFAFYRPPASHYTQVT